MSWQKGPGEGYHAAKAAALRVEPRLWCRRVIDQRGLQVGFIVGLSGPNSHPLIGRGRLARDAWSDAFFKMGGKFVFGRPDYSGARSPYRPAEKKKRGKRRG